MLDDVGIHERQTEPRSNNSVRGLVACGVTVTIGCSSHASDFPLLLVAMSGLTALMWLGQDVPALMSGQVPSDVLDAGLLTNPTHVLDLGLVLPACVVAGFLLARRRAWGFVLGPYFLVNFAVLGVAIVSMTVFMLIDGQPFNVALSAVFSLWTLMSAALAWRLLSLRTRFRLAFIAAIVATGILSFFTLAGLRCSLAGIACRCLRQCFAAALVTPLSTATLIMRSLVSADFSAATHVGQLAASNFAGDFFGGRFRRSIHWRGGGKISGLRPKPC